MKSILALVVPLALATGAPAQTDTTGTAAPSGAVARSLFCTAVMEREPADEITTLAAPAASVTFFTELRGMSGRTVTHKWSLDGNAMGDVPITVGADRWRCYSIKTLAPSMTGTWSVQVVDDTGAMLVEKSFTYTAAP